MKVNKGDAVQPPKFSDNVLNKTFGAIIGRLSDDDVHTIVFRYGEVRVALAIRQRWLAQAKSVAESSAPNGESCKLISASSDWASVADEALEYLRTDQERLDKEDQLARAHIALCDKVITALSDTFADASLTSAYRVGGARDGSPLRHLQLSAAAASRASARVDAANDAWNLAMEGFVAEASARNSFAGSSGSVTLAEIDALSADAFEEWTAWLLERDGCSILRRRGGPNDQGADVIALTPRGLRIVLQCKHSTKLRNRVGPRPVRELNGTARQEHGADIVGIVTNRTLSDPARRFAIKNGIHVIDRPTLGRWATYGVSWLPSDGQGAGAAKA